MWLVFGILAIITALLNVAWTMKGKDPKVFMFLSLSFTALTLCAWLRQWAIWAANEDWSALADVAPNMSMVGFILAIMSVIINGVSFLQKKR